MRLFKPVRLIGVILVLSILGSWFCSHRSSVLIGMVSPVIGGCIGIDRGSFVFAETPGGEEFYLIAERISYHDFIVPPPTKTETMLGTLSIGLNPHYSDLAGLTIPMWQILLLTLATLMTINKIMFSSLKGKTSRES